MLDVRRVGPHEADVRTEGEAMSEINGSTSDGYHTFDELYDHRISLFLALCRHVDWHRPDYVWRSKQHSDGSAIDGWFVLGMGKLPGDQITYHLPLNRWGECNGFDELTRAPYFDGHTSADVLARLKAVTP